MFKCKYKVDVVQIFVGEPYWEKVEAVLNQRAEEGYYLEDIKISGDILVITKNVFGDNSLLSPL
jgi:hypothetical protein